MDDNKMPNGWKVLSAEDVGRVVRRLESPPIIGYATTIYDYDGYSDINSQHRWQQGESIYPD